jgi:hypothetical protein
LINTPADCGGGVFFFKAVYEKVNIMGEFAYFSVDKENVKE